MTFDMSKIHSIFESASEDKPVESEHKDETGANLDNTLGDNDLIAMFDDICPISGDVYAAMKNAAKDPKNLKITLTKNGDGECSKMFIEAFEFYNFCEACGCNEGEAAEEIFDAYKEDVPGIENSEIHVVFPTDCLNKNVLGGENLGLNTKNDWAQKSICGLRRYGIKYDVADEGCCGKKSKSITEADRTLKNERNLVSDKSSRAYVRDQERMLAKSYDDDDLINDFKALRTGARKVKDTREDKERYMNGRPIGTGGLRHAGGYIGKELKDRGIDPKTV